MQMLKVLSQSDFNRDIFSFNLQLNWEPLLDENGHHCFISKIERNKDKEDRPVIYRHIVKYNDLENNEVDVVIYVGEGRSLNGPFSYNLRHQYSGEHGETRQMIKEYILGNNFTAYTEVLSLIEGYDLRKEKERKMIENLLKGCFYIDNKRRRDDDDNFPLFLNNI